MDAMQNPLDLFKLRQRCFNIRKAYKSFADSPKLCAQNPSLKSSLVCKGRLLQVEDIHSSPQYKELKAKYMKLKHEQTFEKETILNATKNHIKEANRLKEERGRIEKQSQRLEEIRQELQERLQAVRDKNQRIREYFEREGMMQYLASNAPYADENGLDVDSMTYEELLELQDKMGRVSKGLTEQEKQQLTKYFYEEEEEDKERCTICCEEVEGGEEMTRFQCGHCFHWECTKEWLDRQKTCPLCKEDVLPLQRQSRHQQ